MIDAIDDTKIDNLIKLRDFLTKNLERLDYAEFGLNNNFSLSQNTREYGNILKYLVSPNAGQKIAIKYDMQPGTPLGQYIDSLSSVKFHKLDFNQQITKINMVMLIACVGFFFGEYEFLKDLENKTEFSQPEKLAMSMFAEDVDFAHEKIVPALDLLNDVSDNAFFQVRQGIKHFDDYYYLYKNNIESKKYGMMQNLERKLHADTRITEMLQYILSFGFKNKNGQRYNRVVYDYAKDCTVKPMLAVMSAARKSMGENYIVARSANLWTNKLLDSLDYTIHQEEKHLTQTKQTVATMKKQLAKYYDMLNPSAEFIKQITNRQK